MNSQEHLYLKLMEECAEVQQRVSKLLQFGPEESQRTAPTNLRGDSVPEGTNRERLQEEINDLVAIVHLLGYGLPSQQQIQAKAQKLAKYRLYSQQLGTLV